jgi:hypothetical protein
VNVCSARPCSPSLQFREVQSANSLYIFYPRMCTCVAD